MNINIKNIINRITGNILSAVLSAGILIPCFTSCSDELIYPPYTEDSDGQEISVPISLSVLPLQSENPQSRAIEYVPADADEKEIHDFWLIEYHENGTRVGFPRYYTKEDGMLPEKLILLSAKQ